MRAFLPFATLLGAVFLLGCQDRGSGPVGPEGLGIQADKTGVKHNHGGGGGDGKKGGGGKALLFDSDATCADGATNTGGESFGHVSWGKVFVGEAANGDDHVHFKLQLKDVVPDVYTIFGNQTENGCAGGFIRTFTVKRNGQGSASGQFNFPVHDPGSTAKVWVTVSGLGGDFRSPAVTMVIGAHVLGHP